MVKLEDRRMGIKFWAIHYSNMTPRFEVFRYVGYQSATGMHYFRSLKKNTVIGRNIYQIVNSDVFKPFCINSETLEPGAVLEGASVANL